MRVFLIVVVLTALICACCTGGRLRRLCEMPIRGMGYVLGALVAQVVVISIVPTTGRVDTIVHLATYVVALAFVAGNLRIGGLWIVGVGGLLNFIAIAANDGVMPASARALRSAGGRASDGHFLNSGVVAHARLRFLGDVFAIPASWPLHNVFSVGDVLIAVGIFVVIMRATRGEARASAGDTEDPSFRTAPATGEIELEPASGGSS